MTQRLFAGLPFLLIPALFLSGYVLYPIGAGLLTSFEVDGSFSLERYVSLFGESGRSTASAVVNSIVVSVLTVVGGGVLGTVLAFGFTHVRLPFKNILRGLAVAPVALPPLVGVIAFLFVFGEGGVIPRVFGSLFTIGPSQLALDGFAAIVAVHVYSFHVYTLLFVSTALNEIDSSVLEAAAVLGTPPGKIFRRIIVPELVPALVGSASLTFMSSMASFSAPLLFGGGSHFLTTLIYSTKLNGDLPLAAAQSGVLMLISVMFFVLLSVSGEQSARGVAQKGVSRSGILQFGPGARKTLTAVVVVILAVELLPMVMIVLVSFAREGSWTVQLLPVEYTVDNFIQLLTDPSVFLPIQNSLLMGIITVLAAAIVGTLTAVTIAKGVLSPYRKMLEPVLSIPFAIPGTVIAVFLITAFSTPSAFTGGGVLVGSFWILPLAYVLRTYPFVLRSASSSLDNIGGNIFEAAQIFGVGPLSNFRKIVLPLILPGIIGGSLLVMIAAIGEFPSSILLYSHSNRPISVEILAQLRGYNFGPAAAYSIALLLLVFVLSLAANRMTGGREERRRSPS